MFDNKSTPQSIKEDICKDLSPVVNTSEGSYTNTLVGGTALEIWKVRELMRAIPKCICIDKDSPEEIIIGKCGDYGITRKSGTKTTAILTIAGADGVTIKKGKQFLSPDGLEYSATTDSLIAGGTTTVAVEAVAVGARYNQPQGRITIQMDSLSGITEILASEASGGTDPESMESLVGRYHLQIRETGTSANIYHYKQWALSVDGVGDVLVQPLAKGPGTVGVVIVDGNKLPVDTSVVTCCKDFIETQRPADAADVIVESATGVLINISATVKLSASVTKESVAALWRASLTGYCKEMVRECWKKSPPQILELQYSKVGYLLMGIAGVEDYSNLTVNKGTINIIFAAAEVPVIRAVVLA